MRDIDGQFAGLANPGRQSGPGGVAVQAVELERGVDAGPSLGMTGDDVDDAEKCVAAIQRRTRAWNEFNPFNRFHFQRKVAADRRRIEHIVVGAIAIDQHQHTRVVVAGARESAHPDVLISAIVIDVDAGDAVEDFSQRPVAEPADLRGGHHAHRRRRFGDRLSGTGRRGHLEVEQVLDLQFFELARRLRQRAGGGQCQGRREQAGADEVGV